MAAPVTIKVDLDASPALNELAELEVLMKSIGHDFRDMDTGSITNDIQEMVDALEDAERRMSNVSREMQTAARAWDGIDFGDMPDGFGAGEARDDGGGGGGRARTSGGLAPNQLNMHDLTRRLESRFGIQKGVIDPSMLENMSIGEINAEVAEFVHEQRGSPQNVRNLGINSLGKDTRMDEDGYFFGKPAEKNLSTTMRQGRKRFNFRQRTMDATPDIDMRVMDRRKRKISALRRGLDRVKESMTKVGDAVRYLKPSMRQWWQLIAMLIPLLISAVGHLLGVAAAMMGVVFAGAALIGLGLIGHANEMGDAWKEAKEQLADFKEDLFEVMSPAAQAFAPIQAEFFDFAPAEMTGLADSLQGLVVYGDAVFDMWSSLVGGLSLFTDMLVDNEGAVEQLTDRFGSLLGLGFIDLFERGIQAAYKHQDNLVQLGGVLMKVAEILYNVSVAVGYMVVTFEPLIDLVLYLSQLLNSPIAIGMMTFIASIILSVKVVLALVGALSSVAAVFGKTLIGMIVAYTSTTMGAVSATLALAGALALVSFGVSAIAGGLAMNAAMNADDLNGPGPGGYGGSGGPNFGGGPGSAGGSTVVNNYNNYEFTNYGEMDSSTENRFRDDFNRMDGEQSAMDPPSATGNTDSSTSDREQDDRPGGV